jgi:anti-sigma regulatory factor (Ser/Thr protein kinase)
MEKDASGVEAWTDGETRGVRIADARKRLKANVEALSTPGLGLKLSEQFRLPLPGALDVARDARRKQRLLVEELQRRFDAGDEIYRIAREALRKAFRHAKAQKIEAEITYGDSEFLLHLRDDGNGIDPFARGARSKPGTARTGRIRADSTWSTETYLGFEYAVLLVDPEYQPLPTLDVAPTQAVS